MKGRRVWSAFVALLFVFSLAAPQALASPLQAAATTSSSQGGCFGYNGVNDSSIPRTIAALRIAVVQPILTSTPYSQYNVGSFYAFYAKETGVTSNVTTNLNLLSTNVSSGSGFNEGWGLSYGMYKFITSQTAVNCGLLLGKNVEVLTDMEVAQGGLFDSGNHIARFDAVILPFSEYVEAQEYAAYQDFVAGGGTLVMMAHSLEYPVTYNPATNTETLVYGHGWAFNGKYAYPIACASSTFVSTCPWAKNNTNWIGGNTCMGSCFHTYRYNGSVVNTGGPIGKALSNEFGGTVFKSYLSHEEDRVTNMTGTTIVSVMVNDSTNLIASFTHQFRKGAVVCFGFFGDDIIATDQSAQYFLLQGVVYGRASPVQVAGDSASASTSSKTVSAGSTISSALGQSHISTPVASPPAGTLASILITLGAVAGVAVAAYAVTRRRKAIPRA